MPHTHSHQRLMQLMAAGIRTSTATDWLPNAGIAPSSDRTAPGRMLRFSAPDRSPAGNAWCLGSSRESRARHAGWAILNSAFFAKFRVGICDAPLPPRSTQLFSSHFSRTLITDRRQNPCEDISTEHHRELCQSPETDTVPAANFCVLFDNKWLRTAPSQVHAK